jgi:predicted DNA-binding protein (UPF0251 family)
MTPTYRSWQAMNARCYQKYDGDYLNYGGRGIVVCDRWRRDFAAFLADLGERPKGMTLDRIDVNGNYEPSNVRWADAKTQTRNRRVSKLEPHEPEQIRWLVTEGYRLSEIARFFEVSYTTVWKIVNNQQWAAA